MPRCLRALAAVLALLLGVAGADVHTAADLHGTESAFDGGLYFPEAAHPEAPLHAEAAQSEDVPPCPACLAQLNPAGTPRPAAVAAVLEAQTGTPLPLGGTSLRSLSFSSSFGRAPPRS